MHLCLSCNQPCSLSSIFCDACRLSLLERREEIEEPGMVSVGGKEELVELASPVQTGTGESGPQTGMAGGAVGRQTEEEFLWSWNTSNLHKVGTQPVRDKAVHADSGAMLTPPLPTRRTMPRRVRLALLVFLIVGVLALTTDGFLLFLSITRHHTQQRFTPPVTGTDNNSTQLLLTPVGQASTTPVPTTVTSIDEAFSLSSSYLSFTATPTQPAPDPQTVVLSSNGPSGFSWQVISAPPSWLHLSSTQGSATVGAEAELIVSVQTDQLAPQTYTAHLLVKAVDGRGNALPGGSQLLNVTLKVLDPCTLKVTPLKMTFTAKLLQPIPAAQTLTLTENGDCARPVNWQISSNQSWVTFSSTSGQDAGSGSTITVQVTNPNKLVGTFNATLTLQAVDGQQTPLSASPATISVTLTVIVV